GWRELVGGPARAEMDERAELAAAALVAATDALRLMGERVGLDTSPLVAWYAGSPAFGPALHLARSLCPPPDRLRELQAKYPPPSGKATTAAARAAALAIAF